MITPARKYTDCDINRYTTVEQIREHVERHAERLTFARARGELTRGLFVNAAIECKCSVRDVCFCARSQDVLRSAEPIGTQPHHYNDPIRGYTLRCTFQRFVNEW